MAAQQQQQQQRKRQQRPREAEEREELDERVVHLARTAKVVKGGRRFAFRAVVVVGDNNGSVGIGVGKGEVVFRCNLVAVREGKAEILTLPEE
jgi:small subunit ribosomal protein S5